MNTPHYELAQNITSLLNMVFIVFNELIEIKSENYLQIYFIVMMFINCIFGLELIIDFIVNGVWKAYSNHLRVWFETLCQIQNLILIVFFYNNFYDYEHYNTFLKLFTTIIFIRALKVLTLMYEIKSLRIIIETMKNLIMPISHMASVLLIIFFLYALGGMYIFGGRIK